MNSIDSDQLTEFLSARGLTSTADVKSVLVRSFDFMSTLPFCDGVTDDDANTETLAKAQGYIAFAMSDEGGGFGSTALASATTLTKESLGRNAITEEYAINSELSGTDPISRLKQIPDAYGALKSLLCDGSSGVCMFEYIG